jgi:glycosyltransferase involved in cell wall biosynthesis
MVVHAYYPLGETRVERQAMALLDHGIEVDVICLRRADEPALDTVNGVQVHRLPVRRHKSSGLVAQLLEYLYFFVLAFIRLTRLHRQRGYHIIQVHNLPDFLVFVALIPKLTGARIILDLHDLMPEFYAERFQRSIKSLPVRLIRWQEWSSCQFADHVITVTELWRQALIERGQRSGKVTVVMNIADDRIFNRAVAADVPDDKGRSLRLIYHGTMARRYGLDLALRAINLVRQTVPDIHMTIHGGGEYRQALENLADELELDRHVQFSTRFVPTHELAKLIKTADLGVVPYRDGVFTGGILPTKLMEYAALGIPAIAARTPAIDAHFDETMVEFFTPSAMEELANCILKLYRDRARLAGLARNTAKFNERFNWPDQSTNYLNLVEELIE